MLRAEILWCVCFMTLLTLVLYQLIKKEAIAVKVQWPLLYMLLEVGIFEWLYFGGWTKSVRYLFFLGFVLAGFVMLFQSFGKRKWYMFRAGGFVHDMDLYDTVALAIRQGLQEERLAPAAVILRYEGLLGFSATTEEQEARLLGHINDALWDTKFTKNTRWLIFFGSQWLVVFGMLVLALFGH